MTVVTRLTTVRHTLCLEGPVVGRDFSPHDCVNTRIDATRGSPSHVCHADLDNFGFSAVSTVPVPPSIVGAQFTCTVPPKPQWLHHLTTNNHIVDLTNDLADYGVSIPETTRKERLTTNKMDW